MYKHLKSGNHRLLTYKFWLLLSLTLLLFHGFAQAKPNPCRISLRPYWKAEPRELDASIKSFSARILERFMFELHAKPYATSIYVLSGSSRIQVSGQSRYIQKGFFVGIPAGAPHRFLQQFTSPNFKYVHIFNRGFDIGKFNELNNTNLPTAWDGIQHSNFMANPPQAIFKRSNRLAFTQWNPDDPVLAKFFTGTNDTPYLGQVVGEALVPPGEELATHSHKEDEGYLLIEGEGTVFVGVGENPIELEKEKIIFIRGGQSHRLVNTGKKPLIILFYFRKGKFIYIRYHPGF